MTTKKAEPINEELTLSGFEQFATQPTKVMRSKVQMAAMAAGIFACTVIIAYGFYHYTVAARNGRSADVYFELKAINHDGHPVAGAKVFWEKTELGVTDSFGEWRKFMRVKLGASLAIRIVRFAGRGRLEATKNLVVPITMPDKGEIQIAKTVELSAPNEDAPKAPVVRAPSKSEEHSRPVVGEAKLVAPENLAMFDLGRIGFKMTEGSHLEKFLLTNMKREASRLGFVIDQASPWQVSLKHVEVPNSPVGLILVQSSLKRGDAMAEERVEFLQNYMQDPTSVAQKILTTVKAQTPKTYMVLKDDDVWYAIQPDVAKSFWELKAGDKLVSDENVVFAVGLRYNVGAFTGVKLMGDGSKICLKNINANAPCLLRSVGLDKSHGFVKAKLNVVGVVNSQDKVFVGGLEAKQVGAQTWEYWAKPLKATNLTILSQERVRFRKKLFNSPTQTAVVSLQPLRIAKR